MGKKINHKRKYNRNARFLGMLGTFAVLCAFYVIYLAVAQITGERVGEKDHADERIISVVGLRGEIFDRNGVLLVGNKTSYNLVYEYGAMPDTHAEINTSLLTILDAIEKTGNTDKLTEDFFPFEGTYPDYTWSAEAKNPDTKTYQYLLNILDNNNLDTKKAQPSELVAKLKKKYKISDDKYTPEQAGRLLRIRYDMERSQFGSFNPYVIARDISVSLVSVIEESAAQGAVFDISTERVYRYPGVASHILGRLGKITAENAEYYTSLGYPLDATVGISGCEAAFEGYLRGKNGKKLIKYDEDGNKLSEEFTEEPISGNDVWLTIDINLQIAAEKELAKSIDSISSANAGAVLALDTDTGGILVTASYPTYDLSRFDSKEYYAGLLTNIDNPLLNRATQGIYAPGSVYKIGAALAALELGEINGGTLITCNKVYPHEHRPECLGTHGSINVTQAITVSCNVFFYELGYRLGIEKITPYTSALGLGRPSGIETGEGSGIVAGPEYRQTVNRSWGRGDDLSAAIGQSDHGYTPLQMGVYMSSIVNGGTRYRAHLLHSVHRFYTGEIIYTAEPEIMENVAIADITHTILIDSMGKVVTENGELTSTFSQVSVKVGGKTGTAQVEGKRDYAVFSGFAPLDAPEIVAVCLIEQGVYGYSAAKPVSAIFNEYFKK